MTSRKSSELETCHLNPDWKLVHALEPRRIHARTSTTGASTPIHAQELQVVYSAVNCFSLRKTAELPAEISGIFCNLLPDLCITTKTRRRTSALVLVCNGNMPVWQLLLLHFIAIVGGGTGVSAQDCTIKKVRTLQHSAPMEVDKGCPSCFWRTCDFH